MGVWGVLHEFAVDLLAFTLVRQVLCQDCTVATYATHLDAVECLRKVIVHDTGVAQHIEELLCKRSAAAEGRHEIRCQLSRDGGSVGQATHLDVAHLEFVICALLVA